MHQINNNNNKDAAAKLTAAADNNDPQTWAKNEGDLLKLSKDALVSQHHIMGGSNVPVYGHLVTADQLTEIEKRKGFHLTDYNSKSIGSSSDTRIDTSSDNFIYANLINEPMDVTNPSTVGPLEVHMSSPNRMPYPHQSTLSGYGNNKIDTNFDKDTSAPYYHYPDLSICQSSLDRDKLYVNTFSSNAQHNFTRVNNTSYSKGVIDKHHIYPSQLNNPKSDSSLDKNQPLQMETDIIKSNQKCPNHHIIVKMSVDLIKTYKNINEIYYRKKRRLKEPCDENYFKRDRKRNSDNDDNSDFKSTQNLLSCDGAAPNKGSDVSNENIKKSGIITCLNTNQKISSSQNYVIASNVLQANINSSSNKDLSAYEYLVKPGEIWKGQYCIEKLIGTGSFGQVVRAKDMKSGDYVAIKIIKNKRNFVEQAYIEIDLLREIGKFQENEEMAQENGANFIVKLKSHFHHRGHLCLVFELLTYTLYDLLKNTNFRGVSLNLTRKFAQQICQALVFLSRPQVQIIHCDLKPENILLLHPRRSAIKVVDFGSSCHANRRIYYYIQSRFYRSPEIILNLEYSHAIDMWSLGCIMAELHTGQPLFIGQFEHEQILRIIEVVGMPPDHMIDIGKKSLRYFERSPSTKSQTKSKYEPKSHRDKDGKKISFQGVSSRSLSDIIGVYTGGPQGRRLNEPGHTSVDYEKFLDLLQKMLIIDPTKRIKPDDALNHPFFVRSTPTSDVNPNLPNAGLKSMAVTSISTSCDKTMISMAAASKGSIAPRITAKTVDNMADKLCGDLFVCTQTPQNQISTSICDSTLPELSHTESSYLSLTTVTTTAN